MRNDLFPWGVPIDHDIIALWKAGYDTTGIARALWSPEHEIANRLPLLLLKERQDRDWRER